MNTSFKTLSSIFFIPLLLLIFPLHSQAGEEVPKQTKDIRIIDNPYEFGDYDEDRADEYEIINVSIEDIKERILKGEPVYFVEEQEEDKRTIESTLIIEAIKNGVDKIDIGNAIINGDLDFHIRENLVDIEESGIEVDEVNKLKGVGVENVNLVSPSINIVSCQLQGNLKAGYDYNLKSSVIFESSISFNNLEFIEKADFWHASFNGVADFRAARFNGWAYFKSASFNGEAYFESASFKEKAYFKSASFNVEADFSGVRFKGEAYFRGVTFEGKANFAYSSGITWEDEEDSSRIFHGGGGTSVTFEDEADFSSVTFKGMADFSGVTFVGMAHFDSVTFEGQAAFIRATFMGKADFRSASFKEKADFSRSFLGGGTSATFKSEADFSSVTFKGMVDFSGVSFEGKADFGSVTFERRADFLATSFNGEADFGGAIFNGRTDFIYAIFNGEASFRGTRFKEKAYFLPASFNGEANFEHANFNGGAYFRGASFKEKASFTSVSFKEKADFLAASFNGEADFRFASFNGEADFGLVSFKEKADFMSAISNGEANFRGTSFKKQAYFRSVSFKEKADFGYTGFNSVASFRYVSFNGEADFREANFKDVVVFSGCTFLSDINLQDTNYQVLRISWKQLEGRLDRTIFDIFNPSEDIKNVIKGEKAVDTDLEKQMYYILKTENITLWGQAYLRLIKNFEDIGDKKSADDAYYHYRYNKPKYKTQRLSERSENIGVMPISLEFPEHLKSKIDYKNGQLIFKGVMSEEEKKELLGLQEDLPDSYKKAVENLYKRSQYSLEYISGISTFEKQLEHIFFGLTCGYGVRPLNALGVGLVLIISFTLFYFIGCLLSPHKRYLVYQQKKEGDNYEKLAKILVSQKNMSKKEKDELQKLFQNPQGDLSKEPIHYKLYNCFYFSVTTFTTVGYGDLQPRGGFKVAAMIEGFLGWMTMALFLVTLGNVWLR